MIIDDRKLDLFRYKAEEQGLLDIYGADAICIYTGCLGVLHVSSNPVLLAKLIMLARHYEDQDNSGMHVAIYEKCNYLFEGRPSRAQLWDYDYMVKRDHPTVDTFTLRDWLVGELNASLGSLSGADKGIAKKFLRWQSGRYLNLRF